MEDLGFFAQQETDRAVPVRARSVLPKHGLELGAGFCRNFDRVSARSYPILQQQIPPAALLTIDNEFVLRGELPAEMAQGRVLRISALPAFLKTYIDRPGFSFTEYLRSERDSSSELHQWVRDCYFKLRELELSLTVQRS